MDTSNDDAIATFIAFTGADNQMAAQFLQMANNDVEMAASLFFAAAEGGPAPGEDDPMDGGGERQGEDDGRDYDDGGVRCHYYSVIRAHPALGPSMGGTVVRLNGTELHRNASAASCRFGAQRVAASVVAGTTGLACVSPASATGPYVDQQPLSLSLNGVDELHVLDFVWYADPALYTLTPQQGSAAGGTMVTGTGVGIVYSSASSTAT